jgi:hypothetical protein
MEQLHSDNIRQGQQDSGWPACSIFLYGTFGAQSEAGARYHRRCIAAFAVLVLGEILLALVAFRAPYGVGRLAGAFLPGAVFGYIVWAFRRYLLELDELARRMQLEAMAWTYLSGIPVAVLLGTLAFVYDWHSWLFNPLWFIALEPVRSVWLYFVSRRY